MKIHGLGEVQPAPSHDNNQKMQAMAHSHLTQLASTAQAVHASAAVGASSTASAAQIANAVEWIGYLSMIDSLIGQLSLPSPPSTIMPDILNWAKLMIQNCVPNADPAAATNLSKLLADFTYTTDPSGNVTVTAVNTSQFHTDWQGSGGTNGSENAWAYIQSVGSSLSLTFQLQYPMAALGLIMLSCDSYVNTTALKGQYYHNAQGPYTYDQYFLGLPGGQWGSSQPFNVLFPQLILVSAYLTVCPQDGSAPSSSDYTNMLSAIQRAFPTDAEIAAATGTSTTNYDQMISNLTNDIADQGSPPTFPFINLPSPPFGPIQGLEFGANPYPLSSPPNANQIAFDEVYDSIWQDLSQYYTGGIL